MVVALQPGDLSKTELASEPFFGVGGYDCLSPVKVFRFCHGVLVALEVTLEFHLSETVDVGLQKGGELEQEDLKVQRALEVFRGPTGGEYASL